MCSRQLGDRQVTRNVPLINGGPVNAQKRQHAEEALAPLGGRVRDSLREPVLVPEGRELDPCFASSQLCDLGKIN